MIENAYNTSDPEKLLHLKRLEADALLDVLRTINQDDLKISQLCEIARFVLIGQIGVRKMVFYYKNGLEWEEGMIHGFDSLGDEALKEIIGIGSITDVKTGALPALQEKMVEYVIPIAHRNEVQAYFVIAEFADTEVEAKNDLIFIETMGNILSVAIRNKQLFREKMEQEFIRKELEVAGMIQRQMLISDFSRFQEIDVYGMNIAHHGVGGDFYDVIKRGKGTTFVCIADVSGKGIGASLLMSNLQANLRALCAQYFDPQEIVSELNQILYHIIRGEKFVTLFLVRIDQEERKLTYVNAGHDYPILTTKDGHKLLESECTFLGLLPQLPVKSSELSFESGDSLFMYTDGLVDQQNPSGEMFGSQAVLTNLLSVEGSSSLDLVQKMWDLLNHYSQGREASDDITMLNVRFL